MTDLFEYLLKMGGMHDAIVTELNWKIPQKRIEFQFEDLYSNFNGRPEYPGQQSGTIILMGVSEVSIAVDTTGPLRVFEFLQHDDEPDSVLVTFSPNGRILARFGSASFPQCSLPHA